LQIQLQKIEEFLAAAETDKSDYDFNRLLISDSSKTKDGGHHRLYYIFRERTGVPDEGNKREIRLRLCVLRALFPLMKSGVKIDLILDFAKSNYLHWFTPAEIDFYKLVLMSSLHAIRCM
jgi:hypothetical protein